MRWQYQELGQVSKFLSGGTPSRGVEHYYRGSFPWVTSRDITEKVIKKSRFYITEEAIRNSATNIVPKGNILLVTRTGVGKVAVAGVDICISQDFTAIVPDPRKLDVWYLYYLLLTKQDYFIANQRGATIQGVPREIVSKLELPLPPLAEQKRIAGILARADRVRQVRRFALQMTDDYLQAVFEKMFGKGEHFPQIELEKLLLENPKNGLYLPEEKYGKGTPIIRINNFYDGVLESPSTFRRVETSKKERVEYQVANGDILINRVNSIEYLGKCAYVRGLNEDTVFESNMMRLRVEPTRISPVYLVKYLLTPQAYSQILRRAKKAVNQAPLCQYRVGHSKPRI